MQRGYLSAPFDLLNVEDLDVIEQARALCDVLVLGVWSDELIERVYGRPPVVGLDERVALARRLRAVEEVLVHDDVDPAALTTPTGSAPTHRVFAVAGRPGADLAGWSQLGEELLPVRRRTESAALQRALAPTTASEDAGLREAVA